MKLLRRWSRLSFVLIGCSETGTVSVRLVLSTCIPVRRFRTGVRTLQFVNSLVQLMFCEHAPSHYRALLTSDRYHTILSSYRSVDTQTLHGNVHHVDHVPNGPTNSAALTTMFPLRLCGGKLLVAVTRERRYGPNRLCVNYDDDDTTLLGDRETRA